MSLNKSISKSLYMSLCLEIQYELNNKEIEMADNVMQVVSSANTDAISKWKKGDGTMCQALKEIMQPEIDEAVAEAINSTAIETAGRLIEMGLSDDDIATATNLTVDVVGGLRKGSDL